jgi:hypothetical protein
VKESSRITLPRVGCPRRCTLTYDDLEHYRKVVTTIHETIGLMAAVDAVIPKWPMR